MVCSLAYRATLAETWHGLCTARKCTGKLLAPCNSGHVTHRTCYTHTTHLAACGAVQIGPAHMLMRTSISAMHGTGSITEHVSCPLKYTQCWCFYRLPRQNIAPLLHLASTL